MGKLKFTFSNILFWLSLVASCLLLENVAFLSSSPKGGLNDTHFFMLFVLIMVGYLAYFVIDHVKNKSTMDFFLLGVLSIAFACGMLAIWTTKEVDLAGFEPEYNYVYTQDIWQQSKHSLSLLVFFTTLYATLFFFNKNYPSCRKIKVMFIILIAICYISIVYSLIVDINSYIYNITYMPAHPQPAPSLFWNSNMFSGMLLMGIASSIGLNIYKKNPLSYISIIAFMVMIIFVGSLTCIITALATVLLYFLIEIILLMRKNTKRALTLFAIYLLIIVGAIVLYASALVFNMGMFSNLCTYLHRCLRGADYSTLTLRTFTWGSTIDFLGKNPVNLLFGVGFRNSFSITGGFWYAYRGAIFDGAISLSSHSGYIQVLMDFGIVGVVLYFAFIVYFFYSVIRLMRAHLRFALLSAIMGACLIAYGVMESVLCFLPNTQGILVGLVFFLPVINKWKHTKHEELGDNVLNVEKPAPMDPSLLTKAVAKVFMGLMAVTASFFVFPYFLDNEHLKYLLINIIAVLFVCLLTLPSIISSMSIRHSRGAFIANVTINLALVFGSFATLIYFYLWNALYENSDAIWVYPILLSIILVGELFIFSVGKKRTARDYLDTLIGASKNSFMGLVGVAGISVGAYFLLDRMDIISPLTLIIYPVLGLLFYYLFSYIVPFKDSKAIVNHYNDIALYSLKKDVLKDRLGVYNEERKD